MQHPPVIVWFRNDLRLIDHPALQKAQELKAPLLFTYVVDPHVKRGKGSIFWLKESLNVLKEELRKRGGELLCLKGPYLSALEELAEASGASTLLWNRVYEPGEEELEKKIAHAFEKKGRGVEVLPGNLLFEPGAIADAKGKPYQVYTHFWRTLQKERVEKPLPEGGQWQGWRGKVKGVELEELFPETGWMRGLSEVWSPGFIEAGRRVETFLKGGLKGYEVQRNIPSLDGTSRLSASLYFGEVSVRELWHRVGGRVGDEPFLKELAWREFAYHTLARCPQLREEPLREPFRRFPWRENRSYLKAWQEGKTGYPYIDAGMRQLKETGWMHNRVRMGVASFLIKHLLQPWQEGERWFWEWLVDADPANNGANWQWSAGCGIDAAPFFRIFNPVEQGRKFDGEGEYIRAYVPELSHLPNEWIHAPWEAPAEVLAKAKVVLGKSYPKPLVDHKEAREKALKAFHSL